MRRALLAVPLLLASCAAPPPPVAPPPLPAPTATASAAPTSAASAAPAAPPRLPARVGAPIDGRFGHVVNCKGPAMTTVNLWPVGKGMLGLCGFAVDNTAAFHVPEAGPARLVPEVFRGISLRSTREQALLGIGRVKGSDLEHLTVDIYEALTRSGVAYTFRRDGQTWRKAGHEAFDGSDWSCAGPCVEISGRTLMNYQDPDGEVRFHYMDGRPGWMPPEASVPGCAEPVAGFRVLALRGGKDRKELWGVGAACGKLATQRWTVGRADTVAAPLDLPAGEFQAGRVWTVGSDWIFTSSDGRQLALFDGKAWSPVAAFPDYVPVSVHDLRGRAWLQIGPRLHRLTGAKLEEVPVPDEGIEAMHVSPAFEIRVWTGHGLYSLGEGDVWHPVTLPAGFEEVNELETIGGRWVYHAAMKPDSDEHRVLVEGASGPPLDIADPHAAISPIAFVRAYKPGCESPFAMLYKLSRVAPRDYDFPATKKALEGQAELSAGRFSEVEALGDRYLVARYEGVGAAAKLGRLVKLVEKQVQGSKPQLLCADALRQELPTTRDVRMK
jgi:hypothetical protein